MTVKNWRKVTKLDAFTRFALSPLKESANEWKVLTIGDFTHFVRSPPRNHLKYRWNWYLTCKNRKLCPVSRLNKLKITFCFLWQTKLKIRILCLKINELRINSKVCHSESKKYQYCFRRNSPEIVLFTADFVICIVRMAQVARKGKLTCFPHASWPRMQFTCGHLQLQVY